MRYCALCATEKIVAYLSNRKQVFLPRCTGMELLTLGVRQSPQGYDAGY